MFAKVKWSSVLTLLLIAPVLFGQKASKEDNMYKVNPYISASIGVVGTTASYFGLSKIRDKDDISQEIVLALDKNDVNSFDRSALFQDTEKRKSFNSVSDIGLVTTFFAPVLLITDKRIKSQWLDVGLLYFEAQSISALMYAWSPLGPQFTNRYRPEAYYDELPLADRQSGTNKNAFFSGHTAITSTASFFMAKVICDFHPELGGKKWLVYGAALIPPAFVGYYRVRALRHFPTDIIAATAIGGSIGFLIPHFHKNKKNSGLSIDTNIEGNGIALSYRF